MKPAPEHINLRLLGDFLLIEIDYIIGNVEDKAVGTIVNVSPDIEDNKWAIAGQQVVVPFKQYNVEEGTRLLIEAWNVEALVIADATQESK